MSNLMPGESPERQWFALEFNGRLMPIGDCGDHESANEIATDLGYDTLWLVGPETSQDWANQLAARGIVAQENNDE